MSLKGVLIALLVAAFSNVSALAQVEPEEVAVASDAYQDSFYESLKQKGIENYDKAITALEKCLQAKPNDEVAYFELGKNYLALKDYRNAKLYFEKAIALNPNNKWYWIGVYDVSFATKDYPLAINTIQKLIPFDEEYKDDLISVYMTTNQEDKALVLIKEMDTKYGKSLEREIFKQRIFSQGKYQDDEIESLISRINENPKDEVNYIALINLYNSKNDSKKVEEVTKLLEKNVPTSEWAQLSAFKTSLEMNQPEKAAQSLYTILGSKTVTVEVKHRVFNEFLIYVAKNPQYNQDLEKAIPYFESETKVDVWKEVGKFFHSKKDFQNAVHYYEIATQKNSNPDVETNLLLMEVYTETRQFETMAKQSEEMLTTFPSQSEFYFYNGLANNQLKQFQKAKDVLEMGMDYVVDNKKAEINFNIQLGEAYNGLGDQKKKQEHFDKANALLQKK